MNLLNEVNDVFYVLLDLDTMLFLQDSQVGYTNLVLRADRYDSKEEAKKAKSYYKNKDRISIKEVKVIVSNMP